MEPIKETRPRPLLSVSRLTCRVPRTAAVPKDEKVQLPTLTGATVREAILMPFTLRVHRKGEDGSSLDERRPDEGTLRRTLDIVGCSDIELERPPQDLSVGRQARVCLLRTLLTGPRVMLADEVDAGLDEENADKVGGILGFLDRFQLVPAAVIVALCVWYVVVKARSVRRASLS